MKHLFSKHWLVFFMLTVQLVFLAFMMLDVYESGSHFNLVLITVLAIILFLGILKIPSLNREVDFEDFGVLFWVPLGALSTFFIANTCGFGGVIAAGTVGTIVSFVPNVFKGASVKSIPVAVYCGAFVGMSSGEVTHGYLFVGIAGLIAGGLLLISKNLFSGVGGKLGLLAFCGVVLTYLLFQWIWS